MDYLNLQLKRPATETIQEEQFKTIASILLSLKFQPQNIPPHVCYHSIVLLNQELEALPLDSAGTTLHEGGIDTITKLRDANFLLPLLLAHEILEFRISQTAAERDFHKDFIEAARSNGVLPEDIINNALTYTPKNTN